MHRNTTVDLARVLAAYGVIALHVPFSTRNAELLNVFFWPLCVPFFYVASVTYLIAGFRKTTPQAVIAKAWFRIGIPYLVWTAIYLGLLAAKTVLTHGHRDYNFWRILLYGESAMHLYFLPTLIMLQAFALAIHLLVRIDPPQRGLGGGLLAGAACYLGWGIYKGCFGLQTLGSVIWVIAYLATAFWLVPTLTIQHKRIVYIAAGSLMLIAAVLANAWGYTGIVLGAPLILPLGGIGVMLLTVGYPTSSLPKWILELSGISFGIYLCHVLFLEAFEFAAARVSPKPIVYDLPIKLLEVTLIFALATGFSLLAKQVPLFRQLLLGEKG